jgi:predicted dehydrogenase
MSRGTNRREFLRQAALAGAGFWVAGTSSSLWAAPKLANGQIQFAGIGVGGKGRSDILQAADFGKVVAICDIDDGDRGLAGAMAELEKKGHQPKKFNDFREMLEKMGNQIDAVTVSTPDHTHAPASVMAMKMKKHVYCQKPLTHSVYEARRMRELAREHRLCTQMGNQGTAQDGLRRAVEIIQAGVLGPVREIHIWTDRPVWDQAPTHKARPKDTPSVPQHVHWDLFLGPAPERPYHPVYHPFGWRGWWDFGTGALGDMACHTANTVFMGCKLGYPTSVSAEAADVNPETCPSWAKVTLGFPARGDQPPLQWFWYEGREGGRHNRTGKRILPPEELLAKVLNGRNAPGSGSILVAERGILFMDNEQGTSFRFAGPNARELEEAAKKVPVTLPRNNKGDSGMKAEWAQAIKSDDPKIALSNFDYAGMLTETVLLGNVAIRTGKKFEWDGEHLRAVNCPEAAPYIKREYRKGWTL